VGCAATIMPSQLLLPVFGFITPSLPGMKPGKYGLPLLTGPL
jgi:hypothetical protein